MNISVSYVEPIGFKSQSHIANFVQYLFNISKKYENDLTKDNLYFAKMANKDCFIDVKLFYQNELKKEFDDRKFREDESKELSIELLQKARENFGKIITDIFYFALDGDDTMDLATINDKIVANDLTMVDFVNKLINNYENPNLKDLIASQYLVAHLNQQANHFHRVIVLK